MRFWLVVASWKENFNSYMSPYSNVMDGDYCSLSSGLVRCHIFTQTYRYKRLAVPGWLRMEATVGETNDLVRYERHGYPAVGLRGRCRDIGSDLQWMAGSITLHEDYFGETLNPWGCTLPCKIFRKP